MGKKRLKILVVNAGSSTYKLAYFDLVNAQPTQPLWIGTLDWGMHGKIHLSATSNQFSIEEECEDIEEGLNRLLQSLLEGKTAKLKSLREIERVGHRIVHGGAKFKQPVLIDREVKNQIRMLIPLAPLHNPINLEGIEWAEKTLPHCPQIAVFDTAFHANIPEKAKRYPVPWEWKEMGIQRYGFHGISHHYCAERAAVLLKKHPSKMINCHLGNGCSLCAIENGKSIDTTMGMTPMEGLMMGTRSGSIDPGIIFYLNREKHIEPSDIEHALNNSSGLLGIGESGDMRELLKKGDERSLLAIEMFAYRLKKEICAMAAVLEGVEVLSFTGGIGENDASMREKTCSALSFLNIKIDKEKNNKCKEDQIISGKDSQVKVLVIHTQEEWMIAKACLCIRDRALQSGRSNSKHLWF